MKLLILTQKVDKNDPTLGFFHDWIRSFARHYEEITVICLQKGPYNLPAHVRVISLGKEDSKSRSRLQSRIYYILRFYKYIFHYRSRYDVVFVHMNQEYVLLGALAWKLWGKKIFMWRNHPSGTFSTRVTVWLSDKVFYTSPYSYTASFKNSVLMPVGIDPAFFRVITGVRNPDRIIVLGRISPSKRIERVIEAMPQITSRHPGAHLDIIGEVTDTTYARNIQQKIKDLKLEKAISIKDPVAASEIPLVLARVGLAINAAAAGFMDKTIFEAMACEVPVIMSNPALTGHIPSELFFTDGNANDLARAANNFLAKPLEERERIGKILSCYVSAYHSLSELGMRLKTISVGVFQSEVPSFVSVFSSNLLRLAVVISIISFCYLGFADHVSTMKQVKAETTSPIVQSE